VLNTVLAMIVGVQALASCGALAALVSAHPASCPHEVPTTPTEAMRCCAYVDGDLRASTQWTGVAKSQQTPALVPLWTPPAIDEHHDHLAEPAAARGHSPPVRTPLLI